MTATATIAPSVALILSDGWKTLNNVTFVSKKRSFWLKPKRFVPMTWHVDGPAMEAMAEAKEIRAGDMARGWPGDGSGTDDLADYNANEANDYSNE